MTSLTPSLPGVSQTFLRVVHAVRRRIPPIGIRTKLIMLIVLIMSMFSMLGWWAHQTIIQYIERREKVDLRDEATNVRAELTRQLMRAVTMVMSRSRKEVEQSKELNWGSELGPERSNAKAITKLARDPKIVRIGAFSDETALKDAATSKNGKGVGPAISIEILKQLAIESLRNPTEERSHSIWSGIYWDNRKPDDPRALMQVLIRDDLRQNTLVEADVSTEGGTPKPAGQREEVMLYLAEVDMTDVLRRNILENVRSYALVLNAVSGDLSYLPFHYGNPSDMQFDAVDGRPQENMELLSFETGSKLRLALEGYREYRRSMAKSDEASDISFQYPDSIAEGANSGLELPGLIHCKTDGFWRDTPWTCKSSLLPRDSVPRLEKRLKSIEFTTHHTREPLRQISLESGQSPKFWLRAGSKQDLLALQNRVQALVADVMGPKSPASNLTFDSVTGMGQLVMDVGAILPPGASPDAEPILYVIRAVSLEEIRNSAQEGIATIKVWAFGSAVLALLLTTLLAVRITQPLKDIGSIVDRIDKMDLENNSDHSDLHRLLDQLPQGRHDEVGAIARQLHTTLETIVKKNQRLRDEWQLQLTLKEENSQISIDKQVAEEANVAKTNFLAMISHDMRQSLHVIFDRLDFLLKSPLQHTQQDDAKTALINARKLRCLIDDVLDYQRFLTGDVHVDPSQFDPQGLAQGVLDMYQADAADRGNRFVLHSTMERTVFADRGKLERILGNLISNACKFTKNGAIEVYLMPVRNHQFMIRISDTGAGMSEEQKNRAFKIQNTTRNRGNRNGTGLGLYICKRLSNSMGGDITFESEEGKGTSFELVLPVDFATAAMNQSDGPKSPAQKPRLLIVDDSPEARRSIREAVQASDMRSFDIQEAASAMEALRLAREQRPDVITLDVEMPEMDGFQLLSQLKEDPMLRRVPVLMVTVHPDNGRASILGADGFLRKPFDHHELFLTIDRIMKERRDGFVLVVDDDPGCRRDLTRLIENRGIPVKSAADGEEALDRIRDEKPSLCLVDLCMPRMDGFALIEKLRSNPETRDIPILVLSAMELNASERATLMPMIQTFFSKGNADIKSIIAEIERLASGQAIGPGGGQTPSTLQTSQRQLQ
ncbi:MAG: response regulator [Pirellula sp.]